MRPQWRTNHGPLDLSMPDDGEGRPLSGLYPQAHEDSEDCLNADGSVGPDNAGSEGGSGICFGYSVEDLQNVRIMEAGVRIRKQPYDDEHFVREFRYAHAAWEMTHEPTFGRRIVKLADMAHDRWSETGPTSTGAGWTPQNIAQYSMMAQQAPHTGIPVNGRALGWVAWNEAMALKVSRQRSHDFALAILETCDLAAFLGTGQVCVGSNTGGGALDSDKVVYCFHQSILAMGCLALCHRLNRPAPYWTVNWALSMLDMPVMPYYGTPSMPAFWYTIGDKLVQANGPGQHGDPAFGWHSSLCIGHYKMNPTTAWLERSARWGPQVVTDNQSRIFTMLQRGIA